MLEECPAVRPAPRPWNRLCALIGLAFVFITAAAQAATTYSLGSSTIVEGPAAGKDSVVLSVTPVTGTWTASTTTTWLHIATGNASGTGNANVLFSIDANTSTDNNGNPVARTGTLSISGQTLTILQAASNDVAAGAVTTLVLPGLSVPQGVAVDSSGNVYVSDSGNGAIKEWSPATQAVTELVTSGLSTPKGIAVDASGNVYFADSGNNAIKEWLAATKSVTTLVANGLNDPAGVAVDSLGNVYVADSGNNAIKEWSVSTQSVTTLVGTGLNHPTGVAVDAAGNVYIADTGNNAVKEYTATAATPAVTSLVSAGLNNPAGVAVDGLGNVYIANTGDNAILLWSAAATVPPISASVTTLLSVGLSGPVGLAVDSSRNFYVADTNNSAVKELPRAFLNPNAVTEPKTAATGGADVLPGILPATEDLLAPFAPTSNQTWLTIGTIANGTINFSFTANTTSANRTANISVLGQQIAITQPPEAPANLTYTISAPTYAVGAPITIDVPTNGGGAVSTYTISPTLPAGLIFNPTTGTISGTPTSVSAMATYTITATNAGGMTTATVTLAVVPECVLGTTSLAEGPSAGEDSVALTVTPTGGAWMAATTTSWLHVSTATASGTGSSIVLFTFDANPGSGSVASAPRTGTIAINTQTLTVTQGGSNYVATGAGGITALVSDGLSQPTGVALDSAGDVYIADSGNNAIKEWVPATQILNRLAATGLSDPTGISVDASGNVYFSDTKNKAIKEWLAATKSVKTLIAATYFPYGLAVDGSGNLYIAAGSASQIVERDAAGGVIPLTAVTGLKNPTGVAVDGSGNVYIADTGNSAVEEFSTLSQAVTTLVSSTQTNPTVLNPGGVAVDGSGNVYIADTGDNAIKEWSPITKGVTTLISTGLKAPGAVAVDSVGDVYIADTGNSTVKEMPRAFLDPTAKTESAGAGMDTLAAILPAGTNLAAPFAPTSNQSWLTIGAISGGVINFSFTANTTNASRTATISLLGQRIAVTQNPEPPAALNYTNDAPAYGVGVPITIDIPSNTGGAAAAYSIAQILPNCSVTIGSTLVTCDSTAALAVGASVTGMFIPTGATVATIESPTSFTLSVAPTLTLNASQTLTNCSVTLGSTQVTCGSTASLVVGDSVTGMFIPAGATIATINSSTSFTLSVAAINTELTLDASQTLTNCSVTLGSAQVTCGSTASLVVGDAVTGTGIPAGSTVATIDSSTTFTLNMAATNTATGLSLNIAQSLTNCLVTNGSSQVTCDSTGGLVPGASVTGTFIPAGSTVAAIVNSTTFTLNTAATNTATALTLNIAQSLTHCVVTGGSSQVTCDSTAGLAVNASITGTFIPAGSTVATIVSSTTFTLNVAATNTTTVLTLNASSLPAGLSFNANTGVLSGTPSALTPSMEYVVTATNAGGSATATLTLTIVPSLVLGTNALTEGPTAGNESAVLAVNPSTGAWTATTTDTWLHVANGSASGTGSSLIEFSFDANTGATRSGTITIEGANLTTGGPTLTVTQAGSPYMPAGALTALVSTGLKNPAGVAVDGAGNVYFADSGNNAIKEWSPSTQMVTSLVSTGVNNPTGVAVDASGNIYIADTGNNAVEKYTPASGNTAAAVTTLVSRTQISGAAASGGVNGLSPAGVAVDSDGNVYVADAGNNAIEEYTPATSTTPAIVTTLVTQTQILGSSGNGGVTGLSPTAVAVDVAGNVYIADAGNNAIEEYTPAATTTTSMPATVSTFVSSGVRSPMGVAVDGSGNVYIADAGNSAIEQWSVANQALRTLIASGLSGPRGVAIDSLGNVYIADTGDKAIKELPRTFVTPTAITEPSTAGSDALPLVLPATENLLSPFAPSSDQSWLTIGTVSAGVVDFSFTANTTDAARTANVTVFGQQIPVTQPTTPPTALSYTNESPTYAYGQQITIDTPAVTGGAAASYSISLILTNCSVTMGSVQVTCDSTTGLVVGATITGTDIPAGSTVASITNSTTFNLNLAATNTATGLTLNVSDPTANGLPTGLNFDTTTGQISGTPTPSTVNTTATYQITATNSSGATSTDVTITILPAAVLGANTLVGGSAAGLVEGPAAGSDSVVLALTPASGTWTATSNNSWLTVASTTASGTGSANVLFNFTANAGNTRTGTLTVGGQTLTVTQAGSAYVAANPETALSFAGLTKPAGVAVDSNGNVYVADTTAGTIQEYTPGTSSAAFSVITLVSQTQIHGASSSGGITGFAPVGVAVDRNGSVYIADKGNNAVEKYSPAAATPAAVTTLVSQTQIFGSPSGGVPGFTPAGVAADAYGNVYIADTGNAAIESYTVAGAVTTVVTNANVNVPAGVAVDSAGNVYIADSGTNAVGEYTALAATPAFTTLVSSSASLSSPSGVAVDGSGNVYIADTGNSAIKVWSPSTSSVTTLSSTGLAGPAGVAVDGLRNVYIADTGNADLDEIPNAYVNPTAVMETAAAGADSLPTVLPTTENLFTPFAPSSDQTWLTIGKISSGVVNFSFSANTGTNPRPAHVTLLGQAIPVTQTAGVVNVTISSAGDVPITAATYDGAGQTLNITLGYAPSAGTNLTLIHNTGTAFISGAFANIANGATVTLTNGGNSYPFVAWYYGGAGRDLVLLWPTTKLAAWGYNADGELGNNDATGAMKNAPVAVDQAGVLAGKTVVQVARGKAHALALTSDGMVFAWGSNSVGQLGNDDATGAQQYAPVAVSTATGTSALAGKSVVAIAAGGYHSLALCSDGTVAAWGYNTDGELGNNDSTGATQFAPVAVNTATGTSALAGKSVVAVSAGAQFSLALCADGTVAAWGYNANGQLGNNDATLVTQRAPVAVNTATGTSALFGQTVTAIAAGGNFSLALCANGTVIGWGENQVGELGSGTSGLTQIAPVAVSTAAGTSALNGKTVSAIAAGGNFSLALCADGTMAAWGNNLAGQLGNGDSTGATQYLPVAVSTSTGAIAPSGNKAVTAIAAGSDFSLALCADGSVAAWGNNTYGELGNNDSKEADQYTPTPVDMAKPASVLAGATVNALSASSQAVYAAVGYATATLSITQETANLAQTATQITISGSDFSSTAANDTVTFNDGAAGVVTAATTTQLTVAFSQQPAATGALNASVTVSGVGTTGPTQVATVYQPEPLSITPNAVSVRQNAPRITILGSGFSLIPANDAVTFDHGAVGQVTAATETELTVALTTKPTSLGALTATVTTYGAITSGLVPTQVATIVAAESNLAPPTETNTGPAANPPIISDGVTITGEAKDALGVDYVEISVNGGAPQIELPTGPTTDFKWSFTTTPEQGVNTVVVVAYDGEGTASAPSTSKFSFTFKGTHAGLAGNYHGLITAATAGQAAPFDYNGLVTVTVTKTGYFTGRAVLGGISYALSGEFLDSGEGLFGHTLAATLPLIVPAKPVNFYLGQLSLTIDTGTGYVITGTVTDETGATTLATIPHADLALYTSAAKPITPMVNVPTNILAQYTAVFQPEAAPNNGVAASDFPQGSGYAHLTVTKSGSVMMAGKLPDGSTVSCANYLSIANHFPVFVPLYGNTGFLTGDVVFDPTQMQTDASDSGMLWLKPDGLAKQAYYPGGWPLGIAIDLLASKYTVPAKTSDALGITPSSSTTTANLTIALADGDLTTGASNGAVIGAGSRVTVLGATSGETGAALLKAALAPSTGLLTGSFTHPLTKKTVSFTGIALQKTMSAEGYFLVLPPTANPPTELPASGSVVVAPAP